MAFFKDGFQKLMKTVKAGDAESAGYRGHLSSTQLRLCEGNLLGPDSANPQTLTSWTLGNDEGICRGLLELFG